MLWSSAMATYASKSSASWSGLNTGSIASHAAAEMAPIFDESFAMARYEAVSSASWSRLNSGIRQPRGVSLT